MHVQGLWLLWLYGRFSTCSTASHRTSTIITEATAARQPQKNIFYNTYYILSCCTIHGCGGSVIVLFITLTGETWGIPNTFICFICRLTRKVTVCSWITDLGSLSEAVQY